MGAGPGGCEAGFGGPGVDKGWVGVEVIERSRGLCWNSG